MLLLTLYVSFLFILQYISKPSLPRTFPRFSYSDTYLREGRGSARASISLFSSLLLTPGYCSKTGLAALRDRGVLEGLHHWIEKW